MQRLPMNSDVRVRTIRTLLHNAALLGWLAACGSLLTIQQSHGASNVALWDTSSGVSDPSQTEARSGWKAVPTDLLTLEANPPKASSDPGYYGREYAFNGDAVVENQHLTALFWSAKGRIVIFSKEDTTTSGTASKRALGKKVLEFAPG